MVLATIGFGFLGAMFDLRGDAVFLYVAAVVSLLMIIGLAGEARFKDRNRDRLG